MTTLERRKQIIEMLCERREMTVPVLADILGVSHRTIQRDVLELSLSYPIYQQSGKHGGICVDEHYYLNKQYLSEEQALALQMAIENAPEESRSALLSILTKFQRPKRKEERSYL